MAKRAYEQLIDGEPESVVIGQTPFYEACCDCGAVHRVTINVIEANDGSIRKALISRWKDLQRTAQTRRWMREKQEGVFSGPSRAGRGKTPKSS